MKKVFIVSCVLVLVTGNATASSMSEQWYMSRGRSNMKIGNYKAAIEAFEKVVEKNPQRRDAMRLLGMAYESQGFTDKAITHWDAYLSRFPDDYEIAFKQADFLTWSRYSYRRDDAIRYYKMGLAKKEDLTRRLKLARLLAGDENRRGEAEIEYRLLLRRKPRNAAVRLEYARFLSADRATLPEAIENYHAVLRRDRNNVEAHAGLAKAYAWQGESDRAVHHSRLAQQAGGRQDDVRRIERDYQEGREPGVTGALSFFHQPGGRFRLTGLASALEGKMDVGPFTTWRPLVGVEYYESRGRSTSGSLVGIGGEVRLSTDRRIEGSLRRRHVRFDGRAETTYRLHYRQDVNRWSFRPGFRRELRTDSLLAVAGGDAGGRPIGAARSTEFFCDVLFKTERWSSRLTPSAGRVRSASTDPNPYIGLDGAAERALGGEKIKWSMDGALRLESYKRDQSGFLFQTKEPLPGGYFSPRFFGSVTLRLVADVEFQDRHHWRVAAGPALQQIHEAARPSKTEAAADAELAYTREFTKKFSWESAVRYVQAGSAYQRYALTSSLNRRF